MRALASLFLVVAAVGTIACGSSKDGSPNPTPTPMELLDQSVVPNPPDAAFGIGDIDCAQTLRSATAGVLTRVEVMLSIPPSASGMLRLDIRPTVSGGPSADDGAALGIVEIDVTTLPDTPTLVSFDFSTWNIVITASQPLAIVAQRIAGTGTVANIHGVGTSVYGNGSAWRRAATVWSQQPNVDFGFQTFVRP